MDIVGAGLLFQDKWYIDGERGGGKGGDGVEGGGEEVDPEPPAAI